MAPTATAAATATAPVSLAECSNVLAQPCGSCQTSWSAPFHRGLAWILLARGPLLLPACNYLESFKVLGRGQALWGSLSCATPCSNSKLEGAVLVGLVGLFNLFLGCGAVLTLCCVGSAAINTPFLATVSSL